MSLALWDKKKAMDTIMQKRKAGGGALEMSPTPMLPQSVKDEDGMPDGKHMAAQDMIGAFHAKDGAKLVEALSNFMDIHSASDTQEDPRDDEDV